MTITPARDRGRDEYMKSMKKESSNTHIVTVFSWVFAIVFFVIGILNLLLVHPVPGIFYLLVSILYIPYSLIQERLLFSIPFVFKIVAGLVILWGTLAVGDLAEILGL